MQTPYGRRKGTGCFWSYLAPAHDGKPAYPLPEPEKVLHERSTICLGCPYPRHGLMCHDGAQSGSCLRMDMQELDAKQRKGRSSSPDLPPATTNTYCP